MTDNKVMEWLKDKETHIKNKAANSGYTYGVTLGTSDLPYISREEAVKKIKSCIFAADDAWESGYNTAMAEIMEWIKHIPAADVQPVKHGHWIEHHDDIFPLESTIECSVCGEQESVNIHNDNFCPNCGCKMGGDSE